MRRRGPKIPFTAIMGEDGKVTCACGHELAKHDLIGCTEGCPAEDCVYGRFEEAEDIPVLT